MVWEREGVEIEDWGGVGSGGKTAWRRTGLIEREGVLEKVCEWRRPGW